MARVIRTAEEHAETLAEIERLIARDPAPGTPDGDRLELLSLLVEDYEAKHFPVTSADPVEAIRFRMEQQGITRRELERYIGSRSKVSEVLSGKRPLTLSMIRALHQGLGIPAESLLHGQEQVPSEGHDLEWSRFPIREIVSRGWVEGFATARRYDPEQVVRRFLAPLGIAKAPAFYRRTHTVRSARSMDKYSLTAWTLRIVMRARTVRTGPYDATVVTPDFLRQVAQLSWSTRGPLLAQEFLQKYGIALVVESHLPRTHLDGAALLLEDNRPVIGLTLRHDRLDNFWFTLLHELAHVALHLRQAGDGFYDDLDAEGAGEQEAEADHVAGEALLPGRVWETTALRHLRSPEAVEHLARELKIHRAIVAGRMRHEAKNFRILNHLVGSGEVREVFRSQEAVSK
jgi:HTH-type transcriptional regulator/antitoxin HigA